MSAEWPWSELGLERDADERAVKRAYATRLKAIDRSDPAQFEALRRAYEAARTEAAGPSKNTTRARPSIASLIKADSERAVSASLEDAVRNQLRQEQAARNDESGEPSDEETRMDAPVERHGEPPGERAHLESPAEQNNAPSHMAERLEELQPPGAGSDDDGSQRVRLAMDEPAGGEDAFADSESILIQTLAAIETRDPARLRSCIARTDNWTIDATRRLEADIIRFCALDTERLTRSVAAVLDERFGWTDDMARFMSLCQASPTHIALIERFLTVLPPASKAKAPRKPMEPIPLDGLASVLAFLIAIGNGIYQGVISDGFTFNFFISAVATFFMIALASVIFQALFRVVGWTRKLGAERLFQALADKQPRFLRNMKYGDLGPRFAFSMLLSEVIILVFLFFGDTLLGIF